MRLAIYGTGGSGRELYEIITVTREWDGRWEEIVFIDDTKPEGEFPSSRVVPFDSCRYQLRKTSNNIIFTFNRKATYVGY